MYDYLIVGSGLFGATCAHELTKKGKNVLVIDRRDHIGGNIYTENIDGINVHKYGAHIFHTSNKEIWDYINQFAEFNNYINSPVAKYKNEMYNLPFNMNTFVQLWNDVITPEDAKRKIEEEKASYKIQDPKNLEEQAISLVGPTIYEKLIKGYTAKQWGKDCKELPSFIIKRLPVRFTFDNNYFNDRYQGIPIGGYTQIIEKMLKGSTVRLGVDFFKEKETLLKEANKVIFTGQIDQFFDFKFGHLEFRSLYFQNKVFKTNNYQGCAVINYTEQDIPYTRVIEHRHFEFNLEGDKTYVTFEYPKLWEPGLEPYYPINNNRNNELYAKYAQEASKLDNVYFGGRLGTYKYLDMDKIILEALNLIKSL